MGSTCSVDGSRDEEPGCDPIPLEGPVSDAIVDYVRSQSKGYEQHYRCRMKVSRLWQVRECRLLREYRREAEQLGVPTQLFHGSSPQKIALIAKGGFQLPSHAGMFGKGVYFARCPLKSANYAREDSWGPFLWRVVTGDKWFERKGGQVLVCDVYLGNTKTLRRSANGFDPVMDLKAGWLRGTFGFGDYHSVHAQGGFFGAVNVEEFIVYRIEQAIPRYVIEFEYERF